VAADDRRIAWLLSAQALECSRAANQAYLCVAAEAGFRLVAMNHASATGGIGPEIEAQALRLGMQCILVNDAVHCRLGASLGNAERRSLARALSHEGFDGLVLCEVCDTRSGAESLLATARRLLRDLDQFDWETYH
jgi:hypothetical protein